MLALDKMLKFARTRKCHRRYCQKIEVHGAVIGRYERDEVKPSIDVAAQIADALEVSLDYLVGNTDLLLDKVIIRRIQDIQQLQAEEKGHLFARMYAFLRDTKAKNQIEHKHRYANACARNRLSQNGMDERNEVKPTIEMAVKIAQALEVSLDF